MSLCGKPNHAMGGLCANRANPVTGACYLHEPISIPAHPDIRPLLAEWDADYNRHAGPPRPDDRKDTDR